MRHPGWRAELVIGGENPQLCLYVAAGARAHDMVRRLPRRNLARARARSNPVHSLHVPPPVPSAHLAVRNPRKTLTLTRISPFKGPAAHACS